jgi:hypothetical protein
LIEAISTGNPTFMRIYPVLILATPKSSQTRIHTEEIGFGKYKSVSSREV